MNYSWPEDYPKLFELYKVAKQRSLNNFFQELADKIQNTPDFDVFRKLEEGLSVLDSNSWNDFKPTVLQCSMKKNEFRGYSQLVDCLNEVKGYLYLKEQGYSNIEFIPELSTETPDMQAVFEGQIIALLEVQKKQPFPSSRLARGVFRSQRSLAQTEAESPTSPTPFGGRWENSRSNFCAGRTPRT